MLLRGIVGIRGYRKLFNLYFCYLIMDYVRGFKNLTKEDVGIAGGKGASLGEMRRARIPVPEGFVVSSKSFEEFMKENKLNTKIDKILDSVDTRNINTVKKASDKIQKLILDRSIPEQIENRVLKEFKLLKTEFVAVRSSATSEDSADAAWAGQLDSFLNTTEKTLIENIKKCWASLFTPRAIFYRFEKKIHEKKISVAVVIQKMINSEESGVSFSVHPVTKDPNHLIIEAGFGLGEAIVSGRITPDNYVVDKEHLDIIDISVNEQSRGLFKTKNGANKWIELGERGKEQVLTEKEIIKLSKLIVKIENHYKFPVDVEWAKENGEFYILQSRPITTLNQDEQTMSQLDRDLYKLSRLEYYYFHNRFRTPIYTFLLWEGLTKHYNKNVNFKYEINNMINLDNDLAAEAKEWTGLMNRINNHLEKDEHLLGKLMDEAIILNSKILILAKGLNKNLPQKSLVKKLELFFNKTYEFGAFNLFTLLVEKNLENHLKDIIKMRFKKNKDEIFHILTTPQELNAVQERELDILKIANSPLGNKRALIENHLEKFAWLKNGSYNGDFYTFQEIFQEIKMVKNGKEKLEERRNKTKIQKKEFDKYFYSLNKKEQELVTSLSKSINFRSWRTERFYFNAFILDDLFRLLGEKFKLNDYRDIFYLTPPEIIELLNGKGVNLNLINERKGGYIMISDKFSTRTYSGSGLKIFKENVDVQRKTSENSDELIGQVAFPGKVTGEVRIILNKKDFAKVKSGEIIVAEMTTPDFIPLLKMAKGIVTNEGGITCHASIISRELKKPCVIGTKIATKVLKNGDIVELDAIRGIIKKQTI